MEIIFLKKTLHGHEISVTKKYLPNIIGVLLTLPSDLKFPNPPIPPDTIAAIATPVLPPPRSAAQGERNNPGLSSQSIEEELVCIFLKTEYYG